jgi:hypothetical protein
MFDKQDLYDNVVFIKYYERIAMPKTNAEIQVRYRKKQKLEKIKDQAFKEWQLVMGFGPRRETPDEIHTLLEKAASLPSGWDEEDFEQACDRIDQLRAEFLSPQDDLKEDVENGAGLTEAFINNPNFFRKLKSDTNKSIFKTHALASHLISALELSTLSNSERAAAVMEAIRHVGRATASSADIAKSDAMIVCQASLPSHYDRPDWFLAYFAKWLKNRLGKELAHELGKRLADFQDEDML